MVRLRAAPAALLWCVVFAALHLYWALGGDVGLASSAGADLAVRRPALFVLGALWGTTLLLLVGAAFAAWLARGLPRGRWRRMAILLGWSVGILLLVRAVVVELVLVTDAYGIASAVGPSETRWSLVLWNPWFVLGGALFVLAARRFARRGQAPDRS